MPDNLKPIPDDYADNTSFGADVDRDVITKLTFGNGSPVKFAFSVNSSNKVQVVPTHRLYSYRSDKKENPIAFLVRVWGEDIRAKKLFRHQLRALDPRLIDVLKTYCRNHDLDMNDYLPPTLKQYNDMVLAGEITFEHAGEAARARLKAREAVRTRRRPGST
jgi:hypothetical protein